MSAYTPKRLSACRVLGVAVCDDFVILACVVLRQSQETCQHCDTQTDGQTQAMIVNYTHASHQRESLRRAPKFSRQFFAPFRKGPSRRTVAAVLA